MKYLALILFFAATSAFAGDSTSVVWTSDTTYVRGGVEYVDPIEVGRKIVKKWLDDDSYGTTTDFERMEAEYDLNPANPNADTWMYREWTDWC